MTLDEIAVKHGTDKSSMENGHAYCSLYEKYLPKKVNSFLEIGCYKGQGIRTFREWYNGEGKFYAMDRFMGHAEWITPEQLQAEGINCYKGDHDEFWFLESIKEQFSVIIDDGSHHFLSQLNIFRRMFPHNIEPGGIYVVEDTFDDPYWGQGIVKPEQNIANVFKRYKDTGNFDSEIITPKEADHILPMIDEINIHHHILFIKKKNA